MMPVTTPVTLDPTSTRASTSTGGHAPRKQNIARALLVQHLLIPFLAFRSIEREKENLQSTNATAPSRRSVTTTSTPAAHHTHRTSQRSEQEVLYSKWGAGRSRATCAAVHIIIQLEPYRLLFAKEIALLPAAKPPPPSAANGCGGGDSSSEQSNWHQPSAAAKSRYHLGRC